MLVSVLGFYHELTLVQVGWMGSAMLMLKTQIGLGVLSIPLAFDALGIIPGIICLLAIAIVVTWSNYMVGVFKRRHPEIYSISDVGRLIFGFWGNLILGVAFVLCKCVLLIMNVTF